MNLFEEAVEKNELIKFAIGEERYFIVDNNFGSHSVIGSWINYILPLVESKGITYVNNGIESMFNELILIENIEDIIRGEMLLYHLHSYYYLIDQKRIEAINLIAFNSKIQRILHLYVNKLEQLSSPQANAIKDTIALIKLRGGLSLST